MLIALGAWIAVAPASVPGLGVPAENMSGMKM
jgi:hypothetical protein